MKDFIELTEEFAKRIYDMENQRKKIGDFLREINSQKLLLDEEIHEEKLIYSIPEATLNEVKIAGLDGGLVKKSFHGIDLMLLRAVGALFFYTNNKLASVEYFPSAIPTPQPKIIIDPLSELEFEINSNLERQNIEISTATELIEKHKPEIMFLHGSIIPHYTWVPEKGSFLFNTYTKMIESYKKLFEVATKNETILAGVIEDSRGTRFCEILGEKILAQKDLPMELKLLLNQSKDTNLLSYVLKHKERTFVFPYFSPASKHPILRDLGDTAKQIFVFYVKTAEFDRPIRVDFLATNGIEITNKISSTLLALSGHSSYGLPSVIIETDQRAKLSEQDLEIFYSDLTNKIGKLPGLFEKRRDQRPF